MEILNRSEYAVPLWQVGFLLVVVTGSMLFRRTKLGLLTIYAFALYWGYLFHSQLFFGINGLGIFTSLYFGGGLGVIVLATIGDRVLRRQAKTVQYFTIIDSFAPRRPPALQCGT